MMVVPENIILMMLKFSSRSTNHLHFKMIQVLAKMYCVLLCTNLSMENVLRCGWLRGSPYIGVQSSVWTVQYFNTANNISLHNLILIKFRRYSIKFSSTESLVHKRKIEREIFVLTFKVHTAFSPYALNVRKHIS